MKGSNAHWISKLIPIAAASADCLNRQVDEALEPHKNGGTSKDGTFAWLYHGSYLEVFSTQTGNRVAAWCFGVPLKDPTTTICFCKEYVINGSSKLVISTDSVMGDLLLVFDVGLSVVTKAIQMPYKVTSFEVISGGNRSSELADHLISNHLQHFFGVLAVGTHCGHVYLIDMNLDEDRTSDELDPSVLAYLDPHSCDVENQRIKAIRSGSHLCLQLAENANKRGSYFYKKPDDEIVKSFPADEVFVSCLHWIQQTGQLAVGFNFGSYQLWRLSIPVLEYSGRYEDDIGPVSHIAFTEPENDPRNFCYLWVSRGPLPNEHNVDYNSYITLYQMGFNKKTWHDGSGYYFEELTSLGPRFEHELSSEPYMRKQQGTECGSRLVSCYTLQDVKYKFPHKREQEDSFDEGYSGPDLSLTVFVWEAGYADPKPSCYLSLFDINRWYHAQMPFNIRPSSSGRDTCPYFVFYGLEEIMNTCSPAGLMDIHVPYSSLNKFQSPVIPAPEQHFYPSSLAFDACFLAENGMVHSKYLGLQRQLLLDLQRNGPSAIVDPTEMFVRSTIAGLLPRTIDVNSTLSELHKREALLCLVLDCGLVPFLSACVLQFSSGDCVLRGCTLRFLLEWTWKRVTAIKGDIDKLCVPLYDWSEMALDKHALQMLHHHYENIGRLVQILQNLLAQPATQTGHQDLETKCNVALLISQHLHMVLWFCSTGFLPENSEGEGEDVPFGQYSYPSGVLQNLYRKRRTDIQKLNSGIKCSEVLHIDGMIEQLGQPITAILEKNNSSGLYPFSNFHSLLNIYLLEHIPLASKLALTFYVLCDLFALLPEEEQQPFSDKLQHFAQTFSLSISMQKFIQGVWLLDHRDFKDALTYLLDPCLCHEVEPWQHTVTIKAYLYQGKHQLALRYIRVKKPPLYTPEDVKLRLTVFLANGLTSEAFEYQRLCRDQVNVDDLLSHLLVGSIQTKSIDQLLQLPITEQEEQHLVSYLKQNRNFKSQELLVLYYLQRSRYIEAIRLNEKLKQSDVGIESKTTGTRNNIMAGYERILPKVQRKLAFEQEQRLDKPLNVVREFTCPKPLSTTVNRNSNQHTITRATLLQAVLQKTLHVKEEVDDLPDQEYSNIDVQQKPEIDEAGPFVCTPKADRLARRVGRINEVVYPTSNSSRQFDSNIVNTFNNTKSTAVPTQSPLKRPYGKIASPSENIHTMRKFMSASDLTLLQTPPVKKRTPPSKRPLLARIETPKTPQSILKSRNKSIRRSPSPLVFSQKIKSELALPTPPTIQSRLIQLASSSPPASPLVASASSSSIGTPKLLRFSMPSKIETFPEEENTVEDSPPSTPENFSATSTPSPKENKDFNLAVEIEDKMDEDEGEEEEEEEEDEEEDEKENIEKEEEEEIVENQNEDPKDLLVESSDEMDEEDQIDDISEGQGQQELAVEIEEQMEEDDQDISPTPRPPIRANFEEEILSSSFIGSRDNSPKQSKEADVTKPADESSLIISPQLTSSVVEIDAEVTKPADDSSLTISQQFTSSVVEIDSDVTFNFTATEKASRKVDFEKSENTEAFSSEETGSNEEVGICAGSQDNNIASKEIESADEEEEEKVDVDTGSVVEDMTCDVGTEQMEVNLPVRESSEKDTQSIQCESDDIKFVQNESKIHNQVPLRLDHELETVKSEKAEAENECNVVRDNVSLKYRFSEKVTETSESTKTVSMKGSISEIRNTGKLDSVATTSNSIYEKSSINVAVSEESMFTFTKAKSVIPSRDVKAVESSINEQTTSETSFSFSKPLNVTFDVVREKLTENPRFDQNHEHGNLQFCDEVDKSTLHTADVHMDNFVNIERDEEVKIAEEEKLMPKSSLIERTAIDTNITLVNQSVVKAVECRKEQADSSDDKTELKSKDEGNAGSSTINVSEESQSPSRKSPGRRSTRRTPTRKEEEGDDLTLSSPSRRRSLRIVAREEIDRNDAETPVKSGNKSFRTPPRPTRLAMPPTPPESSPASTVSSNEDKQEQQNNEHMSVTVTTPTPRRGRGRPRTPDRVKGEVKSRTKARSRSSSPAVVTSTTDDLPSTSTSVEKNVPDNSNNEDLQQQEELKFTFSDPHEVELKSVEEEFDTNAVASSFVFSPPLTRGRSRRLSLSTAATPTKSPFIIPKLFLEENLIGNNITNTPVAVNSPAKVVKRKTKKSTPTCTPIESVINLLPEPSSAELAGTSSPSGRSLRARTKKDPEGPAMTLRTRGQLFNTTKTKRKKPVAW